MIEFLLIIIALILLGPWILPLLIPVILLALSPFIFLFVLLFGRVDVKRIKITRTTTKKKKVTGRALGRKTRAGKRPRLASYACGDCGAMELSRDGTCLGCGAP